MSAAQLKLIAVNVIRAFDNEVDAYVPEFWAMESIVNLEENMIIANLVHRDFENQVARFGDTVHTRKPAEFVAKRKTSTENVTVQDATATNIPVVLNQLSHVSFLLHDADVSLSMKELVEEFISPAMAAQARLVDQVLLGQYGQFLVNARGKLGGLTKTNAQDYILDVRNKMNLNNVPVENRVMIWNPNSETEALKTELFTSAEKVGDGGLALREASLGRKLGFWHFMCQNMASIPSTASDKVTGAINAGNLTKGSTVLTVDGFSAAIGNNSWISVNGDPHRVVSTTGGATPTAITIASPGLRYAITDNDVVTVFDPGAVNNASGYAAGYLKEIKIDGVTNFPVAGQLISFGTDATSPVYTIVQADASAGTILLDRPLVSPLADDAAANIGPSGDFNFAFTRNAIALVSRPLAAPRAGIGAASAVVNHNNVSMRATITYDGNKQATLVTLDMLFGVAVLERDLGAVMLA